MSTKVNAIAGDVVRLSPPLAVRMVLAAALRRILSAIWRLVLVEWLVSCSSLFWLKDDLCYCLLLLTDSYYEIWCGQKANSPLSVKAFTRGPATATSKATNVLVSSS